MRYQPELLAGDERFIRLEAHDEARAPPILGVGAGKLGLIVARLGFVPKEGHLHFEPILFCGAGVARALFADRAGVYADLAADEVVAVLTLPDLDEPFLAAVGEFGADGVVIYDSDHGKAVISLVEAKIRLPTRLVIGIIVVALGVVLVGGYLRLVEVDLAVGRDVFRRMRHGEYLGEFGIHERCQLGYGLDSGGHAVGDLLGDLLAALGGGRLCRGSFACRFARGCGVAWEFIARGAALSFCGGARICRSHGRILVAEFHDEHGNKAYCRRRNGCNRGDDLLVFHFLPSV